MTKLESPVTRITSLVVEGREVDITLLPGDAASLTPEAFEIHLKGMKSSKVIPWTVVLKALGYKVDGFKKVENRDVFDRMLQGEHVSFEEFERNIVALEVALKPFKGGQ